MSFSFNSRFPGSSFLPCVSSVMIYQKINWMWVLTAVIEHCSHLNELLLFLSTCTLELWSVWMSIQSIWKCNSHRGGIKREDIWGIDSAGLLGWLIWFKKEIELTSLQPFQPWPFCIRGHCICPPWRFQQLGVILEEETRSSSDIELVGTLSWNSDL